MGSLGAGGGGGGGGGNSVCYETRVGLEALEPDYLSSRSTSYLPAGQLWPQGSTSLNLGVLIDRKGTIIVSISQGTRGVDEIVHEKHPAQPLEPL